MIEITSVLVQTSSDRAFSKEPNFLALRADLKDSLGVREDWDEMAGEMWARYFQGELLRCIVRTDMALSGLIGQQPEAEHILKKWGYRIVRVNAWDESSLSVDFEAAKAALPDWHWETLRSESEGGRFSLWDLWYVSIMS